MALAYMPESMARLVLVNIDFGFHGAGFKVELARKADDFAGEDPAERVHADLHRDRRGGRSGHSPPGTGRRRRMMPLWASLTMGRSWLLELTPDWMSAPVSA